MVLDVEFGASSATVDVFIELLCSGLFKAGDDEPRPLGGAETDCDEGAAPEG